jgi:hypothetical protein
MTGVAMCLVKASGRLTTRLVMRHFAYKTARPVQPAGVELDRWKALKYAVMTLRCVGTVGVAMYVTKCKNSFVSTTVLTMSSNFTGLTSLPTA